MFLNGTIIVQAINFFIAYFLLSRFFLKFAVEAIQKEKKYINSLYSKLKMSQDKIEQYEEDKINSWNECKKAVSKLKPPVEDNLQHPKEIEPSTIELEPTESMKKNLFIQLKQVILKRID